jgi:cell wall-associated NlpC family hydrolase
VRQRTHTFNAAILRRVRRRVLVALPIACLVAAGCGSTEVHRIAEWKTGPPYIPPPEPARSAAAKQAAKPSSAASETAPESARKATPESARGAPSDAEVQRELEEAFGAGAGRSVDAAALSSGGLATVPPAAPARVAAIINAANSVARKPYVYGGGHGRLADETFVDTAYDCSGSVSFALAAAGLVDSPMDSSTLARYGKPGPGRWVTIYANAGHAFMTVAGLRFDTSGRDADGSRWQADSRSVGGFVTRHPPGL